MNIKAVSCYICIIWHAFPKQVKIANHEMEVMTILYKQVFSWSIQKLLYKEKNSEFHEDSLEFVTNLSGYDQNGRRYQRIDLAKDTPLCTMTDTRAQ